MSNLPTDKIISCFYGSSEDCIKVVNTEGMLMSVNPYGLKVMGINSPKDVIGKDWLSFWHGDIHAKATAALKQALTGEVGKFEGECPTLKGPMKYWEVSIAPLYDDFGNIQWLLVTSRDATTYKVLEETVAAQQAEIARLEAELSASVAAS